MASEARAEADDTELQAVLALIAGERGVHEAGGAVFSECVHCGCSSHFADGDRVCWCDSCAVPGCKYSISSSSSTAIGPPCLRCGCTSEYRDGERSCFCDPCVQAGCLREEAVRMWRGAAHVLGPSPWLLAAAFPHIPSCRNPADTICKIGPRGSTVE